jgi:adenosylcobinamide-phosphate synthase
MLVLIAFIIDWLWGEPPLRLHPVVWFGRYYQWAEKLRSKAKDPQPEARDSQPEANPAATLRTVCSGGLAFLFGAIIVITLTSLLQAQLTQLAQLKQLPKPIIIGLTAIILKPTFALRMLVHEVAAIEAALQENLDRGRERLTYIVSRDTTQLSAAQVRESALESLSENLSDSVIAPLFWFLLLGLPGAYLYRFINTGDAMWGYRNRQYEHWGKVVAKVDDGLNWIPARITGLVLLGFPGRSAGIRSLDRSLNRNFNQWWQESTKTPSPNSGWPMAALALRLDIRLGKPDVYTLNPNGKSPQSIDISRGIKLTQQVGWLWAIMAAAVTWGRYGI